MMKELKNAMIKISKKKKIIIGGIIVCILIGTSIIGYKQYEYNTGYRLSTAERKINIEEQLKQGNYDKAKNLSNKYWIDVNDIDDIIDVYKNTTDRTSLELLSVEQKLEEKISKEVVEKKAKEVEEKKAQEAKEAEEKKVKEIAEKKAKEEVEKSKVKEVQKNNTVKTESTAGVVLMNKSNVKVICTGVVGSNYNYVVKITIQNNASNDISTVFNDFDINSIKLTGDSMISGIVKKGTKEDFQLKTGRLGILTGYFTVADSSGHNITISAEELKVNLNQVPKIN